MLSCKKAALRWLNFWPTDGDTTWTNKMGWTMIWLNAEPPKNCFPLNHNRPKACFILQLHLFHFPCFPDLSPPSFLLLGCFPFSLPSSFTLLPVGFSTPHLSVPFSMGNTQTLLWPCLPLLPIAPHRLSSQNSWDVSLVLAHSQQTERKNLIYLHKLICPMLRFHSNTVCFQLAFHGFASEKVKLRALTQI